jgi:hypothetical protein
MPWEGWIDSGGFVHEEGWKEEPEGHGLYQCVTCGEPVRIYGQRCRSCTDGMEYDRLERESGR